MGSSRQEYWSGLTCPPPRDLPDPGIKAASLLSPEFFTTAAWEAADCSHEIQRHLLLERKSMKNLKSRDITLSTKIHIVKTMVFPVVIYRYES